MTTHHYNEIFPRSVQYTQGACQNMAGVALWLVGAVVAVVVLVGLVIFLVMLRSANLDLLQFVYLLQSLRPSPVKKYWRLVLVVVNHLLF